MISNKKLERRGSRVAEDVACKLSCVIKTNVTNSALHTYSYIMNAALSIAVTSYVISKGSSRIVC